MIMDIKMPLVSICCITYNQENYIRDAIEGFLMQRTTFPIEIIIHDDASTDNTAKVVNEFAEKHPDLIVPIYQTINQYSQGIKPWPNFVFPRARGKYIALCEGDDYWTDPLKLQKQVDFLEANEDYGMVYTDWSNHNVSTGHIKVSMLKDLYHKNRFFFSGYIFDALFLEKTWVWTGTVCIRKSLLRNSLFKEILDQNFVAGDFPLWCFLAKVSKIGYLNEVTAMRQMLPFSATQGIIDEIKSIHMSSVKYAVALFFMERNLIEKRLVSKHRLRFSRLVYLKYLKSNLLRHTDVEEIFAIYKTKIPIIYKLQMTYLDFLMVKKIVLFYLKVESKTKELFSC